MNGDDPWKDFLPADGQTAALPPAGATPAQADPWASFAGAPTVAPIESVPGTAPDKYRQTALTERAANVARGIPQPEGYTERLAKGAGLGWTDELMAGALTPFEMAKRGTFNPAEGYRYAKAQQDLSTEEMLKKTAGVGGTAAEVMGGLATGAGVFTGPRIANTGLNYAANVGKAAGLGAASGAGEGNTLAERGQGALMGGVLGAGIGATLPAVASGAGMVGRILQTPRLRDPENIAIEQVAKAARDSGQRLEDVLAKVQNAHAAGQADYTLADALEKEGQRKLAAQAKIPGPQRDLITDTLMARDLNMPQRTSTEIGKALGAPGTAEQATTDLINQAKAQSSPLYKAAEGVPTWSTKLQAYLDQPEAQAGLKHGVTIQRLENVGTGKPFNPTDAAITHFNEAGDPVIGGVPNMRTLQTVKIGLDKMIEDNTDKITGRTNATGRALTGFKNRMLGEMTETNPLYGEANAAFGGPMRVKEAVGVGSEMASRGRYQDTIPAFQALSPTEQQGVRIGYADALRAPLEKTGNFPTALREKSTKGSQELANLSLYQGPQMPGRPDQLRQFLNREEEMMRTSKAALGGSSTAENLADITSAPGGGELVGMLGSAASGSPVSFARNAVELGLRAAKGESEKQRIAITNMLLAREPAKVQEIADRLAAFNTRRSGYNPWTGRPGRYPEGQ